MLESLKSKFVEYVTPKSTLEMVATGAGWYGRSVALTYGPQLMTKLLLNSATPYIGSTLGAVVVAPAVVPFVTPIIGAAAGALTYYTVATVGNDIYNRIYPKKPIATPTSQPAIADEVTDLPAPIAT